MGHRIDILHVVVIYGIPPGKNFPTLRFTLVPIATVERLRPAVFFIATVFVTGLEGITRTMGTSTVPTKLTTRRKTGSSVCDLSGRVRRGRVGSPIQGREQGTHINQDSLISYVYGSSF